MKKASRITIICSLILLLLLLTTDPNGLPSAMLVLPFVLLFIIILGATFYFLTTFGTSRSGMRFALLVAASPVIMLVLQSLGQLTLRDAAAIFTLFAVVYFYISRFRVQSAD